jgi:hypothetical protein
VNVDSFLTEMIKEWSNERLWNPSCPVTLPPSTFFVKNLKVFASGNILGPQNMQFNHKYRRYKLKLYVEVSVARIRWRISRNNWLSPGHHVMCGSPGRHHLRPNLIKGVLCRRATIRICGVRLLTHEGCRRIKWPRMTGVSHRLGDWTSTPEALVGAWVVPID